MSKKIEITLEEKIAIQVGLSEIENSIGSGDLTEKNLKQYLLCEKILKNLLNKLKK